MNLYDKVPEISKSAFIAPSALVSGQVSIGSNSSVFYGSVIRGESWVLSMELSTCNAQVFIFEYILCS
jgi:carbonic anhydrase/acetyltransferase-like protein (isoleucine patch superfamily)